MLRLKVQAWSRWTEVACMHLAFRSCGLLALAMLAPRFFLSPVAVIEPSVVPTGEHMFPLPILKLQVRRLVGLPATQPWLSTRMDHCFDFLNFWTFEILWLCAPGHASAYLLEGYKTVLILETPFWGAGAVESMQIDIIVLGRR